MPLVAVEAKVIVTQRTAAEPRTLTLAATHSPPTFASLHHAHVVVSPPPPDCWVLETQLLSARKGLERYSNQKHSHRQIQMWQSSTN